MPDHFDQGIGLNGSVKKRNVAVLTKASRLISVSASMAKRSQRTTPASPTEAQTIAIQSYNYCTRYDYAPPPPPPTPLPYATHYTILVMAISCKGRVARCGRSAGCVLCALWAVSAAVRVWRGYPVGVSVASSRSRLTWDSASTMNRSQRTTPASPRAL